ncbi:hypothetical protein VTI74DRAFT_4986 [Chaetomium olivicolor]
MQRAVRFCDVIIMGSMSERRRKEKYNLPRTMPFLLVLVGEGGRGENLVVAGRSSGRMLVLRMSLIKQWGIGLRGKVVLPCTILTRPLLPRL